MNAPSRFKGRFKTGLVKAALNSLYYSRLHKLLAPGTRGVGLVYTLHRVNDLEAPAFAPNRILTVTPSFLDSIIRQVLDEGLDVVSLDEMHERLVSGRSNNRFVSFTFDDGYRDNLHVAYPIFKKYQLPFSVYVPTDFPDGNGELWWVALERVIAKSERVDFAFGGRSETLVCATVQQKWSTFNHIYWALRAAEEDDMRAFMRRLCERHDVDLPAICRSLIMTWDETRQLAADPLVTIGAHSEGHYALSKLDTRRATREIVECRERLQAELQRDIDHFAYPYGSHCTAGRREFELTAAAGFKTGVTTRKGVLFNEHARHLTALPRISLNSDYQALKYNSVFLTGAPFSMLNGFRKLDVD